MLTVHQEELLKTIYARLREAMVMPTDAINAQAASLVNDLYGLGIINWQIKLRKVPESKDDKSRVPTLLNAPIPVGEAAYEAPEDDIKWID